MIPYNPVKYIVRKHQWARLALVSLWPIWLGGCLSAITKYGLFDWQWHVFVLPLIVLIAIQNAVLCSICEECLRNKNDTDENA